MIRLRRPRDLALALRDLARRKPEEAEDYLDTHLDEWESLAEAEPENAADILEVLEPDAAADLISGLDSEEAAEILEQMKPESAASVLTAIGPDASAPLIDAMSADEAADVVGELDLDDRGTYLNLLDEQTASDVRALLAYPPDSAGGLMTTEVAVLPVGMPSGEAIEALRRLQESLDELSYVYVVDDDHRLRGVLSFRELVFARPHTGLDAVMVSDPVAVRPETDREEVAELIQRYNLFALPVVDHHTVLLGIVKIEDVLDALQEEATEDITMMVGAGVTETVTTPVPRSMANRLPWILVNLVLAFVVAGAIGLFEDTVAALAVLAAYMPVVAMVGGNSGAQSLAVVIRAMALGDVPAHRAGRVVIREVLIGAGNGLIVSALAGLAAGLISGRTDLGVAVAIASLVNMVIAGLAGGGIPIVLRSLGLDPALASNIFLTLITDLVGFAGFLAVATLLV